MQTRRATIPRPPAIWVRDADAIAACARRAPGSRDPTSCTTRCDRGVSTSANWTRSAGASRELMATRRAGHALFGESTRVRAGSARPSSGCPSCALSCGPGCSCLAAPPVRGSRIVDARDATAMFCEPAHVGWPGHRAGVGGSSRYSARGCGRVASQLEADGVVLRGRFTPGRRSSNGAIERCSAASTVHLNRLGRRSSR